jgi:esterase
MSFKQLSQDVENLVDKLNIETFVLVGHSIGAKTAMCLSTKLNERIKGVFIVDSAPIDYYQKYKFIYKTNLAAIQEVSNFKVNYKEFTSSFKNVLNGQTYNLFKQNIIKNNNEELIKWKCNLNAINLNFRNLLNFERYEGQFKNKTKILLGERSHLFGINDYQLIFPFVDESDLKIMKAAG